jgi:Sec-independent protein translocase protein TatA
VVHDHCTRSLYLFENPSADFSQVNLVVGVTELIVVLIVALIVIPPEKLPEVMQTVGKILRELRSASNTVVRELGEITDDPLSIRQPPPAIARPPIASPPAPPSAPASES